MNLQPVRALATVAVILCCAACVSQETHPSRVTWGDLARGDRLDAYLESRKAHLEKLELEAQGLSAQLSERQSMLKSVEIALGEAEKNAKHTETDLVAIRQELSHANEQLAASRTKATQLQTQIATLRANLSQLQDKRVAQETIASSEVQLQRLQAEVDVLERGIERTLLVRARHALQIADL